MKKTTPEAELAKSMAKYIEELKKKDPETRKQLAEAALIRTGVLNPDGTPKENIITR